MYKIFFDIGNSSVKWATVDNGYYEPHKAFKLDDVVSNGLDFLDLEQQPKEVYFSSVADRRNVDVFKSLIQSEWQVIPTQLGAQKSCCGLLSGYEDFTTLGDDRWLAMLGALEEFQEPVIVIDAGTAITVDVINEGKHLGGFIVPGLGLQRSSLSLNTADLPDYNDDETVETSNDNILATDTASAILGGTLYMIAAFLNQLIFDVKTQFSSEFIVVMTGGDATHISRVLDADTVVIPDLVLRGMLFAEETIKNP